MIKKLLPLLLLLVGAGAGVGAGIFLRPEVAPEVEGATEVAQAPEPEEEGPTDREYVRMTNQFVVPVVNDDKVAALVVLSLSVEVEAGQREAVFPKEPKLRDSFLQVLFDHANIGGFDGAFTNANNMDVLRGALREVAKRDLGDIITDVLIVEIARQDY